MKVRFWPKRYYKSVNIERNCVSLVPPTECSSTGIMNKKELDHTKNVLVNGYWLKPVFTGPFIEMAERFSDHFIQASITVFLRE